MPFRGALQREPLKQLALGEFSVDDGVFQIEPLNRMSQPPSPALPIRTWICRVTTVSAGITSNWRWGSASLKSYISICSSTQLL
jgi:hypothetical protein